VTNEVLNYLLSKKRKNLNGQLSKGLRDEFARWNKEHSKPEKRYDA
jgi:hypothetical protein